MTYLPRATLMMGTPGTRRMRRLRSRSFVATMYILRCRGSLVSGPQRRLASAAGTTGGEFYLCFIIRSTMQSSAYTLRRGSG